MNTKGELLNNGFFALIFQLAPRFANVILFILLGRLSGSNEAGIFALAATYLLISTSLMRGLDDLIVRQVSREPSRAFTYLANFTFLRIVLSTVLYGLLVLVVQFGLDYSKETTTVILILSLSLIPDSLAFVAQSVLIGQRRYRGSALIVMGVSLSKLMGGGAIILNGGSIELVAWLWFVASLVGMFSHWLLVLVNSEWRTLSTNVDLTFLKSTGVTAAIFIFITVLATLETQMDTIILSGYRGESEVAWFGAATTVAYSLILLSQAYRFSVYPLMTRYAQKTGERLTHLYDNSIRILAALIFPMVCGIIIIAPQIVPFIFGGDFLPTIRVLQILIVALIFVFLNEPNIRMMLVHDRQRWIAIILILTVSVNIILNLVLVRHWGPIGSASARVSSAFVFYMLTSLYVSRRITTLKLSQLIYKPLIATVAMSVILFFIRDWIWPLLIIIGGVIYFVILKLIGGMPSINWRELIIQVEPTSEKIAQANSVGNKR